MVELKAISKYYGEHKVLEGLNLDIEKGKITSFIGSNGAGKSTLLSIIARLIRQNGGSVFLEGKQLDSIKDKDIARKVAVLKQSNFLNIKLTIRELVAFGRFPHSKGRLNKIDNDIIDKSLEYLGILDIQHKYIDQLSGGQRQRAFIAMVVAQDTEYILLDEPLNNLDMKNSVSIMKVLRNLVDEMQKTIVLVLHDINFAASYSDNIVAMRDGKIVKCGRTNDIIESTCLREIFDMDFDVREVNNCKVCLYFR